jgi:uncharacterized protein (TIGR03437 family)
MRNNIAQSRYLSVQSALQRKKRIMRRIHVIKVASCTTLIGLCPLFGQTLTLVGSGYSKPNSIRVSPGQVTTVFASGLTMDPTKPERATNLPLPNSLAGISVTIKQSSPKLSILAPLWSVEQLNGCSNAGAPPPPTIPSDCMIGAITLQIPYELSPLPTVSGDFTVPPTTELVITTNGVASRAFSISLFTDNLHVLSTCDAFPAKQSGFQVGVSGGCSSVVAHADGTLVTANSPAKAGETVVIYAFGLGQTTPAVKSGQATPTPAPVLLGLPTFNRSVVIGFDFRLNAAPSFPFVTTPVLPLFVGLTSGQVGLYQINVQLPSTFPAVQTCTTLSVCTGNPASCPLPIQSNLTIDIGGVSSFDGATICVEPPQQ